MDKLGNLGAVSDTGFREARQFAACLHAALPVDLEACESLALAGKGKRLRIQIRLRTSELPD